ncbi:unnamed protein product [Rotaria socialis]|uniref:Uncharacterized protein n=1 Tax=Rotaria socialis TaxID=392032 RepID=A0A818EBE1_9BILA|nr:unnamed protein product [Rotaria socialis]CAF3451073.1 unnamed protein product [Rotaria socialis]CAF4107495.1 unnamed protein product [Rotaria socialis]CAF4262695.1 unnamed protein product [Rotaria socialis]
MDWRQYVMSFWNDYQLMVNMQLAMYQMLTKVSASPTNMIQNNSSCRIDSSIKNESIVNNCHPLLKNHPKPLKRLVNKRQRLERNIATSSSGTTSSSSAVMPASSENPPIIPRDAFAIRNSDYEELDHRPISRTIMSAYLSTRRHRTVTIFHAKVAQKSYGNEKRFFCPPPCVYLSGDGWNFTIDRSSSSALLNEQERICAMIGVSEPSYSNESENYLSNEMQTLLMEKGKIKYGSAKTLYISDTDKRKYINLSVKILYTDDYHPNPYVGLFQSQKIKVISKPSKKKQSIKNGESVCIQSGTKIALFNRLRSQNVSTRFLHVDENKQFHASAHEWGSFYIHLVDDDDDESSIESNQFLVKEGFIQYGSTIKLVCAVTHQSLPSLIIRKVEKNRVLIDCDEPVSQLHKCAFEFKNHPSNYIYLSLVNERIVAVAGKVCTNERFRVDINDAACWTIISTDKAEYTWFEARGPVSSPITPVPIAKNMVIDGGGTAATIELTGENFTSGLSVWFGETESPCTEYRSNETIIAEVPQFSSIIPTILRTKRSISTPISFVRRDGVIYLTSLVFTYTPQSTGAQKTSITNDMLSPTAENDLCE